MVSAGAPSRRWDKLRSIPSSVPRNGLLGSVQFWLGLVFSIILLALATMQVDLSKTLSSLLSANLLLLSLGLALLMGTRAVFALRWKVLLSGSIQLGTRHTLPYIMIGYFANDALPMRLGDAARAALLGRRHGVSIGLVFGTVAVERVLDLLTVLAIILTLSFAMDIPRPIKAGFITSAGGAFAALTVLFVLAANEHRLQALASKILKILPVTTAGRLVRLVTRFAEGVRALRGGRQLGQALVLSALIWGIAGLATIIWVNAFHLPLPWYGGLFVLAVVNLGAAIPSSPGAIGVYHYLAILALSVWVADKSEALAYAVGTHGVTMAMDIVLGTAFLAREGITLRSLSTAQRRVSQTGTGRTDL